MAFSDELCADSGGGDVVIGCGSLLRGDDAVGPSLIRYLWQGGVPANVNLVDGGTAGMDVAFKMRDARSVTIIDAANTGAEPGTIYKVPGEELEDLPTLDGLHTHSFRWDHALSFGRWLLGDQYPTDITVYLIEIAETTHGAELTEKVDASMREVAQMLRKTWSDSSTDHNDAAPDPVSVEITDTGDLRIAAAEATRYFPADSLVAVPHGSELWLMPLIGPEGGGLLLKQRNLAGDRSALVAEVLPPDCRTGMCLAVWDETNGALRVHIGNR